MSKPFTHFSKRRNEKHAPPVSFPVYIVDFVEVRRYSCDRTTYEALGRFSGLKEAQDQIKLDRDEDVKRGRTLAEKYVLFWPDQNGLGHYEQWRPSRHGWQWFSYDDHYAVAANQPYIPDGGTAYFWTIAHRPMVGVEPPFDR